MRARYMTTPIDYTCQGAADHQDCKIVVGLDVNG